MALAILYQYSYCYIGNNTCIMTFHFPDETQVQQSRFDIKGLIIFYIFIVLLMFGLLNQHHIILIYSQLV